MALATKKIPSAKLRSAAFKRVRADHSAELAGDYVEMIADLIDERGEARCTESVYGTDGSLLSSREFPPDQFSTIKAELINPKP